MARAKKTKRGSPEAIAKRRAARALNRLFEEGGTGAAMDGRTLKRKKRLIEELKKGKGGQSLKAHEVLAHVTELLTLGETLTTIRKMKPMVPPTPPLSDDNVSIVRATQETYNFDPKAWKILGIDIAKATGEPSTTAKPARKRAAKTAKKTTPRRKKR